MSTKRRVKWLMLCAAFVLGITAPLAHATQAQFTAEEYPAVATIREQLNTDLYIETRSDKVSCVNTVFETTLAAASKVATLTPHFSDCTNKTAMSVTIDLNACHFTLEALTYVAASESASATAGVKCAKAGEAIRITSGTCVVHIPEQTGLRTVSLTNRAPTPNTPKAWIHAEFSINNMTFSETDGFLCPFEGNAHAASGKINGILEFKGFKDVGTTAHPTTTGKLAYQEGDFLAFDVR